MKKMPERTCVITREKTLKKDLLRVVRDNNGNVSVDTTGKANGRGAYLKKDKLCYYCYGCNKLETDFKGVNRCKDFVSAVADYQEKIREELKKK